jgi:outer membrane beta-barrel protein
MPVRPIAPIALVLLVLVGGPALAQEELSHVAVANRLYDMKGKIELIPSVGAQVFGRLTGHETLSLGVAWDPWSSIAFEARATYAFSHHTGLADQVGTELVQRDPTEGDLSRVDDLADLWELRGALIAGVRWAPIYGKLALFSETPLHFQAYLFAGAGAGLLHRESVVYCQQVLSREQGTCGDYLQEDRGAPMVSAALGMRFFASRSGSVVFEVRGYAFKDRFRVNVDRTVAESGGATGNLAGSPGYTNIVTLDLGYAFSF